MTFLSGLLGAVIGAISAYLATVKAAKLAFDNAIRLKGLDRRTAVKGGMSCAVLSDGTFILTNHAGEELIIKVMQKRLLEQPTQKNAADSSNQNRKQKDEIYRLIQSGKDDRLFKMVKDDGTTKVDGMYVGIGETSEVQDSETFGLVAEHVEEVIVGTLIDFKTTEISNEFKFTKLYVHRFAMGKEGKEPRGRWLAIYSRTVEK